MRRIISIILLFVSIVTCASAQTLEKQEEKAPDKWKLILGADFDVYFDNREYEGAKFNESQTLFSSRLTPIVGVKWNEKNSLIVGVDLRSDFGSKNRGFDRVRPQVYYQFKTKNVLTCYGIFTRDKLCGDYSEAIFSDSMRFYDHRVQGLLGQYKGKHGYVELSADWCGMFSEESREKFRILSAGRYYFGKKQLFYGGYDFMMFHFAGSKLIEHCVNDNLLLEPYVGVGFTAWADFDIKLKYLQTFQRDRDNEEKYRTPKGGLFQFRMSKWGVFLEEQLYFGEGLQPFYHQTRGELFPEGYGAELYSGDSFFGTNKKIYSNSRIGFKRGFFNDTLNVNAYFAMQYDGTGWGCKQVIALYVRLLKDINLSKKK